MDKENLDLIHRILPAIIISIFVTCGQLIFNQNINPYTLFFLKGSAVLAFLSVFLLLISFYPARKNQKYKGLADRERKKKEKEKNSLYLGQVSSYQQIYHDINIFLVDISTFSVILSLFVFVIGVCL